jgi:hypothetical protein
MSRPLKIAFLTVDDRFTSIEELPRFGAAPTALLQGFEALGDEIELHVVCCTMGRQPSPAKLAPNVWYHGRPVPKDGYQALCGYQRLAFLGGLPVSIVKSLHFEILADQKITNQIPPNGRPGWIES